MKDSPAKTAFGASVHGAVGYLLTAWPYHGAPDPAGPWDWAWRIGAFPTILLLLSGLGIWWEGCAQFRLYRSAQFSRIQMLAFPAGGLLAFALWVFMR